MHIKEEIRVVGIDDGYFVRSKHKKCLLVGVIMRGGHQIDGVLSTKIRVDGDDSTEKVIRMIKKTNHYYQLRIIMTNGITFGGFNVLDIEEVYEKTRIPIIVIIRKHPNFEKIKKALEKVKNKKKKWELIIRAGEVKKVSTKYGDVYYQSKGLDEKSCIEIIQKTAIYSKIPEPVRVAHLVAMGVTLGYSKGKV